MSYELSLKIKKEFELDAVERERKEEEERIQREKELEKNGYWRPRLVSNQQTEPLDKNRFNDDPAKANLHRKEPHHRGALSEELHDAAWREDITLMEEMICGDPSLLDETDSGGQNLLHLSSFWGSLIVVEKLIQLGIK